MPNTAPAAPVRLPRHCFHLQQGAAAVELSILIFVMVLSLACLLQLGRALVIQHVLTSAANSASMHLAMVPTTEAIDTSKGRAKAIEIVRRMKAGAGTDSTLSTQQPVLVFCVLAGTSPCSSAGSATSVYVRATHLLTDELMSNFTVDPTFDIAQPKITYTAGYPRIGFF